MPRSTSTVSDENYKKAVYEYNRVLEEELKNDPLAQIKNIYGPNGNLPSNFSIEKEYNDIKLEIPEGMNEEMVTAIVLGAMMNPVNMSKKLTSSNEFRSDIVEFNQEYFISNIARGESARLFEFGPLMLEGKKAAQKALKEFSEGKPEAAKEMLQTFLNYGAGKTSTVNTGLTDKGTDNQSLYPDRVVILLTNNVMGKPPLKVNANLPEASIIKTKAKTEMINAKKESMIQKKQFIDNFKNMPADVKDELLIDMIFNDYLATGSVSMTDATSKKHDKAILKMHDDLGIPEDARLDAYEDLCDDPIYKDIEIQSRRIHNSYYLTKMDVILSEKGGRDKLKEAYKEAIRSSSEFKKLKKAKTEADIIKTLVDNAGYKSRGLGFFRNVKLPDVDMDPIAKSEKDIQDCVEKMTTKMRVAANKVLKSEYPEYYKNEFKKGDYIKNSKAIDELYQSLKDVTSRIKGSSKNFDDMKDKMKELREFSRELAKKDKQGIAITATDLNKYNQLAEETDALAVNYLDNKTDINSPYAQSRVDAVKELRGKLCLNMEAIQNQLNRETELQMEKMGLKEFRENEKKRGLYSPQSNRDLADQFFGRKYKYEGAVHSAFNTDRSAAFTITTLALAATGKYTMDELTSPEKLKGERERVFDELQGKLRGFSDPDNERWIARNMVEGSKQLTSLINDTMNKIDFSDPNWEKSKDFLQVRQLSHVVFDAFQEMDKFPSQKILLEEGKKVFPDVKSIKEMETNYIQAKCGPLFALDQGITKYNASVENLIIKGINDEHTNLHTIIENAYSTNAIRNEMLDKIKANPGKPFSELYNIGSSNEINIGTSLASEQFFGPMGEIFKERPDLFKDNLKSIQDGSFFEGMNFTVDFTKPLDPIQFSPAFKEKLDNIRVEAFRRDAVDAEKRLKAQNYYSKDAFFMDAATVMVSKLYQQPDNLPVNPETGKTMKPKDYTRKVAESPVFQNSLMSKDGSGKMLHPNDILKAFNKPATVNKMVDRINSKNNEREVQKKPTGTVQNKVITNNKRTSTKDKVMKH